MAWPFRCDRASLRSALRIALTACICLHGWQGVTAGTAFIGVNKFDLAKQYIGTASGGDGSDRYRVVTRAMAKKALADARDVGVAFVRASATGFGPIAPGRPGDLDRWVADPPSYWKQIDEMFDDLDANGLRLVPTFIWNRTQFPSMTGETVSALVSDPDSRAYKLAARYVTEFVTRYRGRETILFYELTNELNLGVDLDNVTRCKKEPVSGTDRASFCRPVGNYTTEQMIGFTKRLASTIKDLDAGRAISSGFSMPRPNAERLRARPEWIGGGASRGPDSIDDFVKNLRDIHEGLGIVSVHLYPGLANARFGSRNPRGTELLDAAVHAAAKAGKPLFVGEFGDEGRVDGRADSFSVRVMDRIVELGVPYSAIWVWQFYQRSPYHARADKDTAFSLEPGLTDDLIRHFSTTSRKLGHDRAQRAADDTHPPRVVLTWPLGCTQAKVRQTASAVASDDSGQVRSVQFLVGDKVLAELSSPPYKATLAIERLPAGEHVLRARASDAAGNSASSEATLVVGASATSNCPRTFAD
jgi:Bacterial Ig domain